MFVSEAVTVTTSAAVLVDPDRGRIGTASAPQLWVIYNNDASESIYLGDDTVTSSTGIPVKAGEYFTIPLWGKEQIYAIAGASVNVRLAHTNGVDGGTPPVFEL